MARKVRKTNSKSKKVKKNKTRESGSVKTCFASKTKKGSFKIEIDDQNRIICEFTTFKGKEYLNIRRQFLNRNDEWQFSQKGLSIPFWGGIADEFIKKFKKEF